MIEVYKVRKLKKNDIIVPNKKDCHEDHPILPLLRIVLSNNADKVIMEGSTSLKAYNRHSSYYQT